MWRDFRTDRVPISPIKTPTEMHKIVIAPIPSTTCGVTHIETFMLNVSLPVGDG
jgi:hypothetical protein